MSNSPSSAPVAKRLAGTVTERLERRLLTWICRRLPDWITPDRLTFLGLFGAVMALGGYVLSERDSAWLWLAILGVLLNWFGDSLDGSLARFRQTERPRYGFFLDHMTDSLAVGMIAVGIGLSPYVRIECGLAILTAYYLMIILSMVTCIATGTFRIGFGGIGPTEVRLLIVITTAVGYFVPIAQWTVAGIVVSLYDLIVAFVFIALIATCSLQIISTARALSIADPSKHR